MKRSVKVHGGVCSVVVMSFVIAACTVQDRAEIRAGAFTPTTYSERGWLAMEGPPTGYRDEKIDEHTYKVSAVGSEVTSQEQTFNIALVRAADIAKTDGYSHFEMSGLKRWMICTSPQAGLGGPVGPTRSGYPAAEFTAHLKQASELSGGNKQYDAEEVLRTKGLEVERPDGTSAGKQRAYIANIASCRTGTPHDPENMKIKSEMDE